MIKTAKHGATYIVCGVLVLIFATFLLVILPNMANNKISLWLGDGVFMADTALDNTSRAEGLSGTKSMKADQALIMAYPSEDKWSVSLKKMKTSVDIVWLNESKKVVYIVKNSSINDLNSQTFTPKYAAKYVIELPAGTINSKAITTNNVAIFQINDGEIKS